MDQLLDGVSAANGAGYDDGDMLEEDDEMRDPNELCEEDLMIDEEEEGAERAEDEDKQPGERTSKSESIAAGANRERKNFMDINSDATQATGVTSASAVRDKGFRIQKKRSIPTNAQSTGANNTAIKKKPGSKSSSKKPYNEGAEENKGWLNDDGGLTTQISGSTGQVPKINPNSYEVDDAMKAESGSAIDGKKLKEAFLMRPPNNQILVMKS